MTSPHSASRKRLPITSTGWDGSNWTLVDEATEARIGQGVTRKGFRGDYRIDGGKAPHKAGSTGRVWTDKGEFFPSVVDCKWVRIPN